MAKTSKQYVLFCECGELTHMAVFSYWPDDDEVYLHVQLPTESFWKRLKCAIGYIFRARPRDGGLAEISIKEHELGSVIRFLSNAKDDIAKPKDHAS